MSNLYWITVDLRIADGLMLIKHNFNMIISLTMNLIDNNDDSIFWFFFLFSFPSLTSTGIHSSSFFFFSVTLIATNICSSEETSHALWCSLQTGFVFLRTVGDLIRNWRQTWANCYVNDILYKTFLMENLKDFHHKSSING